MYFHMFKLSPLKCQVIKRYGVNKSVQKHLCIKNVDISMMIGHFTMNNLK